MPSPRVTVQVRTAVALLLAITAVLIILNMVVIGFRFIRGNDELLGFARMFLLREEQNVPTWYASMLHLTASILLAINGMVARVRSEPRSVGWFLFAILFAVLSLDEAAQLHERLSVIGRNMVVPSGFLLFPWVVPGAIITLVIGVASLFWLKVLPRVTAVRFLVAGAVFVGGALGIEMLEAAVADHYGTLDVLPYYLLSTLEESMELVGVILFIRALLLQLAMSGATFRIADSHPDDYGRSLRAAAHVPLEIRAAHDHAATVGADQLAANPGESR